MASRNCYQLSTYGRINVATNEAGENFVHFLRALEEKASDKHRSNPQWRPKQNKQCDIYGLMQKYHLVDESGIMSLETCEIVFQSLNGRKAEAKSTHIIVSIEKRVTSESGCITVTKTSKIYFQTVEKS